MRRPQSPTLDFAATNVFGCHESVGESCALLMQVFGRLVEVTATLAEIEASKEAREERSDWTNLLGIIMGPLMGTAIGKSIGDTHEDAAIYVKHHRRTATPGDDD